MAIAQSADIINSEFAAYEAKKARLITAMREVAQQGNVGLQKDTSNLFRIRDEQTNRIDVRSFNQVIAIDEENLVADVEGMTTYVDLVQSTLKYSCLPTVVPELKSITIGGALAGVGIESSSFRYGLVHETILEIEILTGSGEVILATPHNEYRDLFFAFPNSYGTLGYALRVKVKLIPAKKYLKLTHHRFANAKHYFQMMRELCDENRVQGKLAYIEGVIFDQNTFVLSTAEFVDQVPYVSDYTYLKIYYKSLLHETTDYLTTTDYIWRWDTDWFWCSKVFLMQNPLMRLLFGKWLLKSTAYWKIKNFMTHNPLAKRFVKMMENGNEAVIQDVAVPVDHAHDFLDFFQREIGIKPIWTCPIHPYADDVRYDFFSMDPNQLYVNFGFWSSVVSDREPGYYNRLIERKVLELGGNKSLYSDVYFTENEFWAIYDKKLYQQLKDKYDPKRKLRDIYQKCTEKNLLQ